MATTLLDNLLLPQELHPHPRMQRTRMSTSEPSYKPRLNSHRQIHPPTRNLSAESPLPQIEVCHTTDRWAPMGNLWYSLNPVVRRILDGGKLSERRGRGLKVGHNENRASVLRRLILPISLTITSCQASTSRESNRPGNITRLLVYCLFQHGRLPFSTSSSSTKCRLQLVSSFRLYLVHQPTIRPFLCRQAYPCSSCRPGSARERFR